MICKYCNSEIQDGSVFCIVCGKRLDDKVQCPKCGEYSDDGNFCAFCGARLKEIYTCEKCGTVFKGRFCPTCGYDSDTGFVKDFDGNGSSAVIAAGTTGAPEAVSKLRKSLPLILSVIGLVGVAIVYAFTFLTGVKDTFIDFGAKQTATQYLYYFFGDAYSDLAESYGSGFASLGTIVSAALLVTMTVMTILSVYKFVKSYKSKDFGSFIRIALLTYVLYVMLVFMYRSIATSYYSDYSTTFGVNTFDFSMKYSLNGWAISGLVVGGVLIFFDFLGNIAVSRSESEKSGIVKKFIIPWLSAVCVFVAVCVLSGLVARFKELFRTTLMDSDTFERYPFARWGYETGDGKVFAYGLVAQLADFAFILFGMLMVYKLLIHMYDGETEKRLKSFSAVASVFLVIMFVFALVMRSYMVKNQVEVFGYTNQTNYPQFFNLYIGFGFFVLGLILCIVHIVQKQGGSETIAAETASLGEDKVENAIETDATETPTVEEIAETGEIYEETPEKEETNAPDGNSDVTI